MQTKHQILGYKTPPRQIEAFGGVVFVRSMDGKQRDEYEALMKKETRENLRAWIAVNTICDETGNLLFTAGDIPELNKVSYKELDRVVLASLSINELDADSIEELKTTLAKISSVGSPAD